jgi:predicted GTPase
MIVGLGLVLPALSLIPFGSLWLWEKGFLLYWAIGACLATLAAYAFQAWLLRPVAGAAPPTPEITLATADAGADPIWSPREMAAWRDVVAVADRVDPRQLASRDAVLGLAQDTIAAVARRIHPEVEDPLWRFTVPEALALTERVSARLGPFIAATIPLGDQLTVAQMMRLYRWRTTVNAVNRAYDIWRVLRLFNPLAAATQEVREHLSKKMYELGRDELGRQLAKAYVREIGRAAIDLYGGRLKVSAAELESYVTKTSREQFEAAALRVSEPLRILVVGQTGAGKSSLVNALLDVVEAPVDVLPMTSDFVAYRLQYEGLPSALLIDSPPLKEEGEALERITEAAGTADLVLWVTSATRADRHSDRVAMDTFRHRFDQRLDRHRPPVIVVLSGIDLLRPFREWSPPYDLRDLSNPKAASISEAVMAVAHDLAFDASHIVPVSVRLGATYNVDALWAEIMEVVPEAQRARLVRTMADLRRGWDWRKILRQAGNAGRVLARSLTPR